MNDKCVHLVEWTKACPWCNREAAHFPIKKPFQIYQKAFNDFVQTFAEHAKGPLAIVVSVQDLNGMTYTTTLGPPDVLLHLTDSILKDIEPNA